MEACPIRTPCVKVKDGTGGHGRAAEVAGAFALYISLGDEFGATVRTLSSMDTEVKPSTSKKAFRLREAGAKAAVSGNSVR
jgi:hypothetical protein